MKIPRVRSIGKIRLPRAIVFCAACYSIGLPPEMLGLNVLDRGELLYILYTIFYTMPQ
jgi:phosphoenolpyruvate carboxylase